MVNYPDLSNLNNASGIGGFLSLPNSSYPYFWAWILGGIWVIIVLTLYFSDKEKLGKTKLLSNMAIASLSIIILGTIGSITGFISIEIMTYILTIGFVIIGIWFFSKD